MKVGIALFAYNRSRHFDLVLSGLKKNKGIDEIYVFQDGLKCEADREEWIKVTQSIENIEWCKVRYILASQNKGLAYSIINGINEVFKQNDAVIVLEDDCVPSPNFISFMKQCFEKYVENEKVLSVCGYSWPIKLIEEEQDIYFCGRPCPWGWGTWKNRWETYTKDYNLIQLIREHADSSKRLAYWGTDLENMLISNIQGTTNSWYVFWALNSIYHDKYCINPYESLIDNIGFDGTGVHCTVTDIFNKIKINRSEQNYKFKLPEIPFIKNETVIAFSTLYGSYIYQSEYKKVLVYGIGNYLRMNLLSISKKYNIEYFVDKNKKYSYYAGKKLIPPKQIQDSEYDYIIIMVENIDTCNEIKKELINKYHINRDKIVFGLDEV